MPWFAGLLKIVPLISQIFTGVKVVFKGLKGWFRKRAIRKIADKIEKVSSAKTSKNWIDWFRGK